MENCGLKDLWIEWMGRWIVGWIYRQMNAWMNQWMIDYMDYMEWVYMLDKCWTVNYFNAGWIVDRRMNGWMEG